MLRRDRDPMDAELAKLLLQNQIAEQQQETIRLAARSIGIYTRILQDLGLSEAVIVNLAVHFQNKLLSGGV